jgi:hypothetical protein
VALAAKHLEKRADSLVKPMQATEKRCIVDLHVAMARAGNHARSKAALARRTLRNASVLGVGAGILGGKTGEEVRIMPTTRRIVVMTSPLDRAQQDALLECGHWKASRVRSMVSRPGAFSSHPCRALREWGLVSGSAPGRGGSTKAEREGEKNEDQRDEGNEEKKEDK